MRLRTESHPHRVTIARKFKAWLLRGTRQLWSELKLIQAAIRDSLIGWTRSGATLHAAALSFFTLLSLAPLVVFTVAIASQFFSQPSVEARLVDEVEQRLGTEAATYVLTVIKNNRNEFSFNFTTILSMLVLLYGASTMFYQLQVSLNLIWGFPPPGKNLKQGLLVFLKTRSLAALFALSLGALLMISLLAQTVLQFIPMRLLYQFLPGLQNYRWLFALLIPPLMLMLVFMLLFKILLGKRAAWRYVWPGAALTTALYWVGQSVFDLYFASSAISHLYGTAGSVVIVMLWVYYAATILLFGAKFTWGYISHKSKSLQIAEKSERPV
jgi:membrane protein